jgi:quercetin dioxygenase-like cupin family protein
MRKRAPVYTVMMALLWCVSIFAQTPAVVPTQDPGVARAPLMDRAEVRIVRVEIQPGAVRKMHTHDDVRFHLFIPLTTGVELTLSGAKAVALGLGQPYFLEKGTPHGFRNTGTSLAMALEVFVKDGAPAAEREALGFALAKLSADGDIASTADARRLIRSGNHPGN